jgi:ATP-dependent DNA helicase RecQ
MLGGASWIQIRWNGLQRGQAGCSAALALGHLRPDSEAFGAFKLTGSSRDVLKGITAVMLREAPSQSTGLLGALRAWRSETARKHGVPAYVVFNDATLEGIATTSPRTHAQLRAIAGIGDKKLERYGDALIALVASKAC